jgi:hypothetical protein
MGGSSTQDDFLGTIYRLSHAEAQWELMTQKLKTNRWGFVAFPIPEEFANCTIH